MIHGFLKACTVSPALRVADCAFNTQQTIAAMQRAAADGVQLRQAVRQIAAYEGPVYLRLFRKEFPDISVFLIPNWRIMLFPG